MGLGIKLTWLWSVRKWLNIMGSSGICNNIDTNRYRRCDSWILIWRNFDNNVILKGEKVKD